MLPQKQLCLARNSLGMLCGCQALSGGRCAAHSEVRLVGVTVRRPSLTSREWVSSFGVWRQVFAPQVTTAHSHNTAAFPA